MVNKLSMAEAFQSNLIKNRQPNVDILNPRGIFKCEHYRDGKLINVHDFPNMVMNAAVNSLFDVMFNSATQIAAASWYMGLIVSTGYSAIAATDTMASHAGWNEATGYTNATRPAWGQGATAARSITNASPVSFIANATATIKGLFITSNNVKSGTTGLLWSAGLFTSGDANVNNLDELRVTYTLGA